MAKKRTSGSKKAKSSKAQEEVNTVRDKWAEVRKSFSGVAKELPLKSILKKASSEHGPLIPETWTKSLFDINSNVCQVDEEGVAFEDRVKQVGIIYTTDEKCTNKYLFKHLEVIDKKDAILQEGLVKVVKWDENANKTFTFEKYGVNGSSRGSRDRAKVKSLLLTLGQSFTDLYGDKVFGFKLKAYREYLEKRLKWDNFVKYARSRGYDAVEDGSMYLANVMRLYDDVKPEVIESLIDHKYMEYYSHKKYFEEVVAPRIEEEEGRKRAFKDNKCPLITK